MTADRDRRSVVVIPAKAPSDLYLTNEEEYVTKTLQHIRNNNYNISIQKNITKTYR